jgi:hypothetical protein
MLRFVFKARLDMLASPEKVRAPTPVNSDDEDGSMTEEQKRIQASALRKSARASTGGSPAPSRFEGAGDPSHGKSGMTTRSQTKTKGIEGDQRVSKELVPVKKASGAGGLRLAAGSGQTGTVVARRHPPKRKAILRTKTMGKF